MQNKRAYLFSSGVGGDSPGLPDVGVAIWIQFQVHGDDGPVHGRVVPGDVEGERRAREMNGSSHDDSNVEANLEGTEGAAEALKFRNEDHLDGPAMSRRSSHEGVQSGGEMRSGLKDEGDILSLNGEWRRWEDDSSPVQVHPWHEEVQLQEE